MHRRIEVWQVHGYWMYAPVYRGSLCRDRPRVYPRACSQTRSSSRRTWVVQHSAFGAVGWTAVQTGTVASLHSSVVWCIPAFPLATHLSPYCLCVISMVEGLGERPFSE